MRGRRRRRAGFSMLETLLMVSVFAFVLLAVHRFLDGGIEEGGDGMRLAGLRRRADATAERLVNAVQETTPAFFDAALLAGQAMTAIDVRAPAGTAAGQVQWGPPVRIAFVQDAGEEANGLDDDGDGLVDEGSIQWIQDPDTAGEAVIRLEPSAAGLALGELPNGLDDDGDGEVDEPGVAFRWDGATVSIRVTFEARDSKGRPLRAAVETSAAPRNS